MFLCMCVCLWPFVVVCVHNSVYVRVEVKKGLLFCYIPAVARTTSINNILMVCPRYACSVVLVSGTQECLMVCFLDMLVCIGFRSVCKSENCSTLLCGMCDGCCVSISK